LPKDVIHDEGPPGMITQALGKEIRRVREHLGWTRGTVVNRMSRTISVQTLANYEYGIRPCTVEMLVAICQAMGVSAADVVGLALQRAEIELPGVHVDLRAVVRDNQAELRQLRRWARNRLADDPNGPGVARIDRAIIEEMAVFLGFSRSEFLRHLFRFTPEFAPQR
jgi:transcriptional regulator with XRE-family HTH domain